MTMNLPPQYNQSQSYGSPQQLRKNFAPNYRQFNPSYNNQRMNSQSTAQFYDPRIQASNIPPQYSANRSYSPINRPQYNVNPNQRGVSPNFSRQNFNNQIPIRPVNQVPIQNIPRQNNFARGQQNFYGMNQGYSQSPVYPQNGQRTYQAPNYPQYPQNMYSQQNSYPTTPSQYYSQYPQNTNQNYSPLYTMGTENSLGNYQNINNLLYNQVKRNVPEQSINSNFSYQNANFDVNYSVEQNFVHCVICNQTYKAAQKRQHLQLHRQKVKNVNVRPIDQNQLKRLQKYNAMTRKGLMIKPIVQPDEFNVQYNPNQFVLKKVTQYRDVDAPHTNTIQIQTEDFANRNKEYGYNQDRPRQNRNVDVSPSRGQNTVLENQRATSNIRFNNESVREEQKIFLSDKFDNNHREGEQLKSNYNQDHSLRESDRRSNYNQSRANESSSYQAGNSTTPQDLGYQQGNKLNYRNAESYTGGDQFDYDKKGSLHNINETNQYRKSNKNQIPINQVIRQASRVSEY